MSSVTRFSTSTDTFPSSPCREDPQGGDRELLRDQQSLICLLEPIHDNKFYISRAEEITYYWPI
jgi:hypothetical protein